MLNARSWFAGVVVLALAAGYVVYERGGSDEGSPADDAAPLPAAAAVTVSPPPTPSPTPRIPPLTLADVFPPRDISSLNLDPARLRTVIATGDVIPARHTDYVVRHMGNAFEYTVDATKDIVSSADVTVVNLEAPLIEGCPEEAGETFTFCGQPGFTSALQTAGVDVVTLENNHIGNYGRDGIDETIRHLEAAGIKWADRTTPAIVDIRGLKFGFLAFNGVIETIDRQAMAVAIKALRPQVDVLAVAFHWGAEYVSVPQAAPGVADDDPVEIAHLALDAGADWIIGNHPHWVQAVEVYQGKRALSGAEGYIAYAHGNFIFDQMWSYETRVGVIGKYTFYDDKLVRVEYIPTLIENYAQPRPLQGAEAQAVLDGMKAASEQLAAAGR